MTETSYDGLKWLQRGGDTDDHLTMGLHEAKYGPTFSMLVDSVPDDGIVVVVGAHVGTWALRFAQQRPVLAYEANSSTAATLMANAGLNELESRIEVLNLAAWDTEGLTMGLVDANGRIEGGSARVDPQIDGDVLTTTLDIQRHYRPRAGFVLIDVEGAEARVLRGARQMLEIDRPRLSIELHEGHPDAPLNIREQVERVLIDHHYEWRSEIVESEEHIIAWPTELTDVTVPDFIPEGVD